MLFAQLKATSFNIPYSCHLTVACFLYLVRMAAATYSLLEKMRAAGGPRQTEGLSKEYLHKFIEKDARLKEAIEKAHIPLWGSWINGLRCCFPPLPYKSSKCNLAPLFLSGYLRNS